MFPVFQEHLSPVGILLLSKCDIILIIVSFCVFERVSAVFEKYFDWETLTGRFCCEMSFGLSFVSQFD